MPEGLFWYRKSYEDIAEKMAIDRVGKPASEAAVSVHCADGMIINNISIQCQNLMQ